MSHPNAQHVTGIRQEKLIYQMLANLKCTVRLELEKKKSILISETPAVRPGYDL